MAVKVYKAKTPGQRHRTGHTFEEITKDRPERSLIMNKTMFAGRNFQGRITVRHRGSGVKRQLRLVDFTRNKFGIPAKVSAIEYDPNRTARLALLVYADGEKRYIIAPVGVKVGDNLLSGPTAEIRPGNNMPLANIPVGTTIHAIELQPGRGAQICRSAGSSAQLLAKEGKYAQLRMPSGEVRLVMQECTASI
jgi:large subunit ribosomal protein L2